MKKEILETIKKYNGRYYQDESFYNNLCTHFLVSEGFARIHFIDVTDDHNNLIGIYLGIQLNPKRLIEKDNPIEILHEEDIYTVAEKFDVIVKTHLHLNLSSFYHWTLNRIDYATQLKTEHVKEYIELFQRADTPSSYFEEKYIPGHNKKGQREGSMYYESKSVTVNFYDKEYQKLDEKDVTDVDIQNAKNVLRLEIQCKKGKTDYIRRSNEFDLKHLYHFLDLEISRKHILGYYKQTVGEGNFYKLNDAIGIINQSNYSNRKKKTLIDTLRLAIKLGVYTEQENSL